MKLSFKRRAACLGLTAVMAVSLAAGNAVAFAQKGKSGTGSVSAVFDTVNYEDVTGKIDLTGVALQNLSPSVMENLSGNTTQSAVETVIVKLKGDCLLDSMPEGAEAADYVSSYTGGRKASAIENAQTNLLSSISNLGISYDLVYKYNTVTNAVAIKVNTAYISTIKSLSTVESVYVAETYAYPKTTESVLNSVTTNPSNVYSTGIYNSSAQVAEGYDGSGMTVAILDTGLDYTHAAFSNPPKDESKITFTKDYVAGKINEINQNGIQAKNVTVNDVYINSKVPFAYDYADKDADVYPSYSQHGTHVAGIVAGSADYYTDSDGKIVTDEQNNPVPFRGVAPEAQLVICKVFTDDLDSKDLGGATSDDILAALDDCVKLGVDIINMSLGTSAGFSSKYIEGDDEGREIAAIYESIQEAGISLICAASNDYSSGYGSVFGTNLASNPDSGTVGSPSTFTGAMSVASINGQYSPFMIANGSSAIFYQDASDENQVRLDFIKQLLYDYEKEEYSQTSETFKYVVIPGIGREAEYSSSIIAQLKDKSQGRTIAVITRGTTTFKEKIETLMSLGYDTIDGEQVYTGADAVIICNNVAGSVGMSLGEIENPIPAVSVTLDAGNALKYVNGQRVTTGLIEVNTSYQAGPFMNEYSSWGTTPDLLLKPEVTAHGGEITSTVAGGYAEMSGTSMASPNLAGFVAILRGKLKEEHPEYTARQLTTLTNQIIMSTATTVYDTEGLPYSPRKQGAGLATLSNAFTTNAYLYTTEAEDNRPKIELKDDAAKTGKYTLEFYVKNTGSETLQFTTKSIFMTESLASDGLAVAEKAHLFGDIPAVWKIDGATYADGATVTVPAGADIKITVVLELSTSEKRYLDSTFENGMFIEGFLKLESLTSGQCGLTLPFMGFYGDWKAAPMLDYDCYEISEFLQDTNYNDVTRPQASVWATQAYANYYNEKYTVPLGSFVYVQDESADQMYTDPEHAAISRYNVYNGEEATGNYLTTTGVKALYAGLLRNAELVTCDIYNSETGELIGHKDVYRVNKSYAAGGSAVPSQVLLEIKPDDYGLVNNGKYELDFHFYFEADDAYSEAYINSDLYEENSFSMIFYVDYEAPVLVGSRIRYEDHNTGTGNKVTQTVHLDLDIFDNNYAQSVILCYSDGEEDGAPLLDLATDYITPVYNANKNGTTTVSIDITDFYEKYNERLYVQLEDYALNHRVYRISFATSASTDTDFEIAGPNEITIGVNETYKVALNFDGNTNLSNFVWTVTGASEVIKVKNGEIFGAAVGDAVLTVSNANGTDESKKIIVHVIDKGINLTNPAISFGAIESSTGSLVKASGTVKVNAGVDIPLVINCDPWYYPVEDLDIVWESNRPEIATVDQSGNVMVYDKKGTVSISATISKDGIKISAATVTLSVQDPFTISNYTLTAYHGRGGEVVIPNDKNVMSIGSEAFKDNDNITKIIIPKTVTQIGERAFLNCTALEEVYFVQEETLDIPTSALTTILRRAFVGCTSLKKVDFSNCKKLTLDREVFYGCAALETVGGMTKIGRLNDMAFYGCTSLTEVDLSGLHTSGSQVFANCTSLADVKTDFYTAIGVAMFYGCTSLKEITINNSVIAANAFEASGLEMVNFGDANSSDKSLVFSIGAMAFYRCVSLTTVNFNGYSVSTIGDMAFAECDSLTTIQLPESIDSFGDRVFESTPVTVTAAGSLTVEGGAVYSGNVLMLAPQTISSGFAIKAGTTEIAPYAFSGVKLSGITTLTIPSSVTVIGEGAFAYSQLQSVTIPENVTAIPANAFAGSSLKQIEIPAGITSIGAGAFALCENLSQVTFADSSSLKSIGDGAFYNCVSLAEISLPDGAKVLGGAVFAGCTALKEAVLPSVTSLGAGTFYGCTSLEKVTFGADAKTAGDMTFFGCISLTEVTLGDATSEIGFETFASCTSLAEINLNNVTVIGDGAFAFCTSLAEVTGLDKVVYFGAYAFANCRQMEELNLAAAVEIGDAAFINVGMTSVTFAKVEKIGAMAFRGGQETVINLPATLKELGDGAFMESAKLTAINVSTDNKNFFSANGVVYRIISVNGAEDVYELCVYPTAKFAEYVDNVRQYDILEETVTVQAYAFAGITAGTISRVTIPYSVKTIGSSAFYNSGIAEYRFYSITAPVLLAEYYTDAATDEEDSSPLYLFYTNFGDEIMNHVVLLSDSVTLATARIYYPTNGVGYDNYVYTNYFGQITLLGELMDDLTRSVNKMIDAFVSLEEIESWNSLEVNDENRAMVKAFVDQVIAAHAAYNTVRGEVQLGYLGDNIQKLADTENALKSVKARFGLSAVATSMILAEDSAHRTTYVEGEKFSMAGLKLIVVYDDLTTEVADVSRLSVGSAYAGGLTTLDRYVTINGYGVTVRINVTVTEGTAGGGSGANVGVIVGCVVAAVAVLGGAAAAVVVILLKRKKKAANTPDGEAYEEAKAEEVKTEEVEAGEEKEDAAKTEEVAAQSAAEEVKPAKAKNAKPAKGENASAEVKAENAKKAKTSTKAKDGETAVANAKPAKTKTRKNNTDKKEEE